MAEETTKIEKITFETFLGSIGLVTEEKKLAEVEKESPESIAKLRKYWESDSFSPDSLLPYLVHSGMLDSALAKQIVRITWSKESMLGEGVMAKLGVVSSNLPQEARDELEAINFLWESAQSDPKLAKVSEKVRSTILARAKATYEEDIAELNKKFSNNTDSLNKVFKDSLILKGTSRTPGESGTGDDGRTGKEYNFDTMRAKAWLITNDSTLPDYSPLIAVHYDLVDSDTLGLAVQKEKTTLSKLQNPGNFLLFRVKEAKLGERAKAVDEWYYNSVEEGNLEFFKVITLPEGTKSKGSALTNAVHGVVNPTSKTRFNNWTGISILSSMPKEFSDTIKVKPETPRFPEKKEDSKEDSAK